MRTLETVLHDLPDTDKPVVSILSGGLDSTILTYLLERRYGKNVHALSFDYNQKQRYELTCAINTCHKLALPHKILNLHVLGDIAQNVSANISGTNVNMPTIKQVLGDPQPVTYVPFRNMLLTTFAYSYAESIKANYVFSGLQIHDEYNYWDTTLEFINSMNAVAAQNRQHKIQLLAPFASMAKKEELELSKDLGNVDFLNTLTCYNPDGLNRSCGKCPSCSERIQNFKLAGMKDPIPYQIEIKWDV